MLKSNYSWALDIISGLRIKIGSIAEIGSRDALDGIFLAEFYAAKVDIFEPDPNNIITCRKNLSTIHNIKNISFHSYALSNKNETVNFLSIDPEKYDNPGAGGFYEINFSNRSRNDPDKNREPIQKPIAVQARRFDTLGIPAPDLIAMDVQGAELVVLEGFGDLLRTVKLIILETSFSENYIGGSSFPLIDKFLLKNNFSYYASDRYKNKRPHSNLIRRIFNQRQEEFNCLYVNNAN